MPGIKGMRHKKPDTKAIRQMAWRSMRILRTFTLPDLQRTVPGATYVNLRKFISGLTAHGIVVKTGKYVGGRAGDCQRFQLSRLQSQPHYPTVCDRCGQILATEKYCLTPEERERERETNKDKETEKEERLPGEVTHDAA